MENAKKTRRSVVTENAKNSQVCGHIKCQQLPGQSSSKKFQKLAGPRSQKYANKPPSSQSKKMQKLHMSAFIQNAENSQVCGHRNMPKTRMSAVKEKFDKPTGLWSQIYANKLPGLPSQRNEKNA